MEKGKLLEKRTLSPAQAIDWEDMTADNDGQIYIGDFGDNWKKRNHLKIYRYHLETEKTDSIVYHYPSGAHYNCRSFFLVSRFFTSFHEKPIS